MPGRFEELINEESKRAELHNNRNKSSVIIEGINLRPRPVNFTRLSVRLRRFPVRQE